METLPHDLRNSGGFQYRFGFYQSYQFSLYKLDLLGHIERC